ncbi:MULTISPECIES: hypothetical protein [Chitinophaga]|uniref:TlpA family protein disulfide reductase n=1 Tax=Chitinophaga TaxID=79328 RepID=UPI0009C64F7A|nr:MULTISPECIES: hypothetical protein [Chitinophaga]OMP74809.1 hypothetical protein BW716_33410 [[Flexibacter] sp. ATCC 35208]WPQ63313.1 hypothetical protein SIO70_00350 [Chitinophaga sancti]
MKYFSLLLLTALLAGCYARVPEKTGLEGKPIPHYTVLLSDSVTYYNTEHIKSGRPAVFVYFGTYCVFSKAQAREIADYMDKMKNIDFYFVTTSEFGDMKKFYKEYKLDKFKNVIMGKDYSNFFADYYETAGVPFIAIYGKDGKMIAAFDGKVSPRQIRNCALG